MSTATPSLKRSSSTERLSKLSFPTPLLRKHSTDQAFTSALYNSLAIIFLIIGISLCGLLLIVLQAFVRSILWALLTGAFLFSFKHYLTDITCKRLELIESTSSCLTFQVIALPFQLVDSTSDYVWDFCRKKYKQLLCIVAAIVFLNYFNVFYEPFISYLLVTVNFFSTVATFFVQCIDSSWKLTCTFIIGYALSVVFYWNNEIKFLFRVIAIPTWICFLILVSHVLGQYRMFFLITFFILTCVGIASYMSELLSRYQDTLSAAVNHVVLFNTDDDDENFINRINVEEIGRYGEQHQSSEVPVTTKADEEVSTMHAHEQQDVGVLSSLKQQMKLKFKSDENASSRPMMQRVTSIEEQPRPRSNRYFSLLFWCYISVKLWSYPVVSLIVFIIIWKLIKIVALYLSEFLYEKFNLKTVLAVIRSWIKEREEVLAPKPFKILLNFYYKGDHKMNKWLQTSLHSIISAFMILGLLSFLISAIIILAMQVQNESVKLMTIISNIVNENIYAQPQLKSLLPEKEKVNELLQEAINKLYLYGRDWLSNCLKSFISTAEEQKIVEKQLLGQWDMLYSFLSQKASNITTNMSNSSNEILINVTAVPSILTVDAAATTARSLLRQRSLTGTSPVIGVTNIDWKLLFNKENLNYNHMMEMVKENIGVFMSLLDSLYLITKSNINIIFTIVKASTSLIFQSGFAVLNFFISFIVYITALFYLLASSTKRYKPLQWLNEITILKSNYGQLLSKAIEESIKSVFVASLKMAFFYGLYTWLIYNIFGLSISYLPSILASIFGFLPILSTYYVAIPGILELWLLQNQPFYAVVFLICHILPTYIVDMAIYSDIKGGHPYFTGLAIAGGLYCLGLEGALIGPIVLCLFIVIIKMNKEILSMSTTTTVMTPQK